MDKNYFRESLSEGENPLYNVLLAYSKHNPEVGYCQGMNYLAGLVLVGVDMKEDLAFTILIRLMEADGFDLAGLYDPTLKKLFEFADHVYSWLLSESPKLEECFREAGLPLTTMLASPFMALFANITGMKTSLHVLDRLIMGKTDALVDIIKFVF